MVDNNVEMYQAISIELLLNRKVEAFFQNPNVQLIILHANTNKNSQDWKRICIIEQLIVKVRESIAFGQLKRALKLMIALDTLMNKYQKKKVS